MSDERRSGRDRRHRGWRRLVRENWYRDIWLLIITGVSLYGVFLAVDSASRAEDAVTAQQVGRGIAIRSLCGATNAVIDAGRATITGGGSGVPPALAAFLERHGYPPEPVRQQQAAKAADAYARAVSNGVATAIGPKGRELVQRNGSLNCERVVDVSAAQ